MYLVYTEFGICEACNLEIRIEASTKGIYVYFLQWLVRTCGVGEIEMHSLKTLRYLIVVFCVLFLTSCNDSSASLPTIEINENNVDTISFDETIRINNCGNATNSEQTKERSFSTSIEGAIELGVNYQIVEGNISAKYGQHRSATTSQKLIAAPNTNMEFVLRWSEEVRAGNVTVNGKTSTYTVRIPVSVEQIELPPKN